MSLRLEKTPKALYAQLPQFRYQSFGGHHYQTFDRKTLRFSTHPIIAAQSGEENKDSADPEPEKAAEAEQPAKVEEKTSEEATNAPAEESSSSNSEGKWQQESACQYLPLTA